MGLLIIDDDEDMLEVLGTNIEVLWPNKIYLANSIEKAIELEPYCRAIISDVTMPNQDRLETFLKLIDKPIARCSGIPDYRSEIFLPKPFKQEELESVIQELISTCYNSNIKGVA